MVSERRRHDRASAGSPRAVARAWSHEQARKRTQATGRLPAILFDASGKAAIGGAIWLGAREQTDPMLEGQGTQALGLAPGGRASG
jgi:hypothetical protein